MKELGDLVQVDESTQGFTAAKQFSVNLRKFLQAFPMMLVVLDGLLHHLLLGGTFEEKLQDMAGGQVGNQIIERAMALALSATAVGFAAGGKPFDIRTAEQIGRNDQLTEQRGLALTQGQRGDAAQSEYLSRN